MTELRSSRDLPRTVHSPTPATPENSIRNVGHSVINRLLRRESESSTAPNTVFSHEQNEVDVHRALRASLAQEGVPVKLIESYFTPGDSYGMFDFANKTVAILDRAHESDNPNFRDDIINIAAGRRFRGHKLYPASPNGRGKFLGKNGAMGLRRAREYRTLLMDTYARNPDTTEALVKNNIVGLHASGSATLLSSLRHGLLPLNKLRAAGHEIPNGAKDGDKEVGDGTSFVILGTHGREFTPFIGKPITPESLDSQINQLSKFMKHLQTNGYDHHHVTSTQAAINRLQHKKQFLQKTAESPAETIQQQLTGENFPVIWGLSSEKVRSKQLLPIDSDVDGEFLVGGLKPRDTPVILVPRNKIELVKQLVAQADSGHTVLPIDDIPKLSEAVDHEIAMRAIWENIQKSRNQA